MSSPKITAVVFDIGGVLIDWNPEFLYTKLIRDPDERHAFLTSVCTPEWNHQMDQGRSVPEAVATLGDQYPEQAELIKAWWSRWPEMLGGEIPGSRRLAEALRCNEIPLFALTNWSAQTWPLGVQRFPFLVELFDGIVVSGQERIAKPDPRIFEILNQRYDLDPTTTAFIDDSTANIQTARGLEFFTHTFTTADRLGKWLHEHRLLTNP
jgi:2-haloacid dehalogenase